MTVLADILATSVSRQSLRDLESCTDFTLRQRQLPFYSRGYQRMATVLEDIFATNPKLNHVTRDLGNRVDFNYPRGTGGMNQIQQIAPYTGTVKGGTISLVFEVDSEVYETTNLPFNAVVGEIQQAIDTILPGQIEVGGVDLFETMTFTFSGDKVEGRNHHPISFFTKLRGGGKVGKITRVQSAHQNRPALAALIGLGVVKNCPPFGKTPDAWEVRTSSQMENYPSFATLDFLTRLYFQQENNKEAFDKLCVALNR